MADFKQDGKLLRIETPLGEDKLLLAGVVGEEAISRPFSYRLHLYSPDFDIKPEQVIGKHARILIAASREGGNATLLPWSGFFSSFSVGGRHPKEKEKLRVYHAELVPWFALLKHHSTCRIFQDKTVVEILEEVFGDALERHFEAGAGAFGGGLLDMSRVKSASFPKLEYCVQYNETDFNFASRLMEEFGIFYFFRQGRSTHTMILAPDRGVFGTTGADDLGFGDGGVTQWQHRFDHRTGRFTLTDYNFLTPDTDLEAGQPTIVKAPTKNPTEQFLYPGRYTKKNDGTLASLIRMQEEETKFHVVEGSSVDHRIHPGMTFKVPEHDIASEKGKSYIVNAVNLVVAEPNHANENIGELLLELVKNAGAGGFDKIKEAVSGQAPNVLGMIQALPGIGSLLGAVGLGALNTPWVKSVLLSTIGKLKIPFLNDILGIPKEPPPYTNNFVMLPIETPFRPARVTPKPEIRGPQTAKVMAAADGEDFEIDEHGRIKVKFFWDREHKKATFGDTSCFMRVSQLWAGAQWGGQFLPRAGMEVIVEFLDADPDRPIVTGCVYNGNNKTPFALKKYKSQSGIKTRTTPAPKDKDKFHMLRFDDAAGSEQVLLRSQRRLDVRAFGSFYETNHANRHMVVGWKDGEEQGGNLSVTVGGDHNHHVNGGIYKRTEKDLNLCVVGNTVMDLQGSQVVLVGGKTELNAKEIILEASQKISLKVGGNFIVIDASGVTIVGTTVKINSGGAGTETGDASIEDPCDAAVSDTGEPGWLEKHKGNGHGPCRKKRKLKGQHHIAPPRPGEPAAITAIRNKLQHSAAGRHALEVYDRHNVQPAIGTPGAGSFYSGDSNKVTLDPNDPTAASTFVHEMNHAEAHNTGTEADINKDSKNDYVKKELEEEARGTALQNQANKELAEAGQPEGGTPPSNATYNNAYNKGAADHKAAHPNATPAEIDAAGKQAAEKAVLDDFKTGKVVTSTTNETYPDYYGKAWDAAHPAPPPATPPAGGSSPVPATAGAGGG